MEGTESEEKGWGLDQRREETGKSCLPGHRDEVWNGVQDSNKPETMTAILKRTSKINYA